MHATRSLVSFSRFVAPRYSPLFSVKSPAPADLIHESRILGGLCGLSEMVRDGPTDVIDSGQIAAAAWTGAPRVSIGLPVYNGERWLSQSVESILAQSFTDFELVICDNASTDGTEAICRGFAGRDERVRYLRNARNIGGMRNATLAFEQARGEYFRWAAHDDVCEPTLIERLVEVLDDHPEVVAAVSPSISIDGDGNRLPHFFVGKAEGKVLGRGRDDPVLLTDALGVRYPSEGTGPTPSRRFREVLLTRGSCEGTYGLIRSDVLRRTCLQQPFTSSDFVLLCDLALRGPFHVIDEPLFYRRQHGSNRYKERGPARMAWSNPDLAETGRISLPHWLQLRGYIVTLHRADQVSIVERVKCVPSVLRWMRKQGKLLATDLAFGAVMALHDREWRRACYVMERWAEPDPAPAASTP